MAHRVRYSLTGVRVAITGGAAAATLGTRRDIR
jgi:hypothetical protein